MLNICSAGIFGCVLFSTAKYDKLVFLLRHQNVTVSVYSRELSARNFISRDITIYEWLVGVQKFGSLEETATKKFFMAYLSFGGQF